MIAALGNPTMQEKHWKKVWQCVGEPPASVSFNFASLLKQGIAEHLERVEEISAFAGGEAAILTTIKDIRAEWEVLKFDVAPYRDTKDRFRIQAVDEIVSKLEDNQMTV